VHYWLSHLPSTTALRTLVTTAMTRWRIERDHQDLEQEFGLCHDAGRGWRGVHQHATLDITAQGLLVSESLEGGGGNDSARAQSRRCYPKATRRAALASMLRLNPDFLPTLRHLLARTSGQRLDHCPWCALTITTRNLWHSKIRNG